MESQDHLYFGISFLYLYDKSNISSFQDGIFPKISYELWCNTQKIGTYRKQMLTREILLWYAESVGAVVETAFFATGKIFRNFLLIMDMLVN